MCSINDLGSPENRLLYWLSSVITLLLTSISPDQSEEKIKTIDQSEDSIETIDQSEDSMKTIDQSEVKLKSTNQNPNLMAKVSAVVP